MTDEIIDAVCAAVGERFGEGAKIYTEAVEQGLDTPCFFVMAEKDSLIAVRGGRYKKTVVVRVEYIPDNELKPRAECEDVSFELFECLELIRLGSGDVLRGTDRSADYSDGILVFSVIYSFEIFHTSDDDNKMDGFEIFHTSGDGNKMDGSNSGVNYGKK